MDHPHWYIYRLPIRIFATQSSLNFWISRNSRNLSRRTAGASRSFHTGYGAVRCRDATRRRRCESTFSRLTDKQNITLPVTATQSWLVSFKGQSASVGRFDFSSYLDYVSFFSVTFGSRFSFFRPVSVGWNTPTVHAVGGSERGLKMRVNWVERRYVSVPLRVHRIQNFQIRGRILILPHWVVDSISVPTLVLFLPCCPRSNAFETETRAYRHPANGT